MLVCRFCVYHIVFLEITLYSIFIITKSKGDHLYGTDLFCPSHPPSEWLKIIFLRWFKLNFRNGFGCWILTHHLIRQSRSFFKQKMGCRTLKWVCTVHPKLGVFSRLLIFNILVALITQLIKKLQQWSLYEVIKDILVFGLNTKRPLSDIWLLSYKPNSFECFLKKIMFRIFSKTPKLFCLYLSNIERF